MPRENSFSDSDGRSLTPDLEDELATHPVIATFTSSPAQGPVASVTSNPPSQDVRTVRTQSPVQQPQSHTPQQPQSTMTPGDKFRSSVRKIIAMRRGSLAMSRGRVGAEPGVDPRRGSAFVQYGHIKQQCLIEIADYSAVRSSFGRMTNQEFITMLRDERASAREPWVKVRWINVGGISWDVVSALAIKYGAYCRYDRN